MTTFVFALLQQAAPEESASSGDLLTPNGGLMFWTFVVFVILFIILAIVALVQLRLLRAGDSDLA
jgi:hypothetical protein